MNIALWIMQVLLAVVFLMAGAFKATQTKEKVVEGGLNSLEAMSPNTIRTIGILELLGALGVVLPMLTGILPWLTPLAAAGLALTMVGAIMTHLRRSEYPNAAINLVLMGMALFVVYGRFVAS